jgi:hypothetical protein
MPFAKVAVIDVAVTVSPSTLKLIDPEGVGLGVGVAVLTVTGLGDVGVLPPPHAAVTTVITSVTRLT